MTADSFEQFLNDISVCFLQRRFSMWRSRLQLPFSIITRNGPVTMPDDAAIRVNFDFYLRACDVMRLDLIDRRAIALEDCKDGTWLGTFETRLVSDGVLATAPYTATALLHWVDTRWHMSSMLNGRGHDDWTGQAGR